MRKIASVQRVTLPAWHNARVGNEAWVVYSANPGSPWRLLMQAHAGIARAALGATMVLVSGVVGLVGFNCAT